MTKILKSATLAFANFDLEVAEHAEKVRHWREHMRRVDDDKAKGDAVAPIDRHQPYDRPRAHELIEAAIDEGGNVAYELADDSHVMLRRQKDALIAEVCHLEAVAIAGLVPPGKARLRALREARIRETDAHLGALLFEGRTKPGLLSRMFGSEDNFDVAAAVAEQRPAEDTAHLEDMAAQRARISAIGELAAQATHDIEDLTAENIGAWQAPDFNGV